MLSFFKLAKNKKWVVLQAVFLLTLIFFLLKILSFKKCCQWLNWSQSGRFFLSKNKLEAERIVELIEATSTKIHIQSCLVKSLSKWWILKSHGIRTELKVGVRRQQQKMEAHAWVVAQGETSLGIEEELETYQTMNLPVYLS